MTQDAWEIVRGDAPLAAAAIHDGHAMRPEVRPLIALSDAARLTEEDPGTGAWAEVAPTRFVGRRSRFEFDLNRPREQAVYLHPADSWGLRVWNSELPPGIVEESLGLYDGFYREVEATIKNLLESHPRLVVYDLHTYNHRRRGPYAEFDDAEMNPEVNLGTGTMDRRLWAGVVDRFIADLSGHDYLGRRLDVRENVKFFGGEFSRRMHGLFPERVCVLAIEFKKFFMDEWTGEADPEQLNAIREALAATVPGVLEELELL